MTDLAADDDLIRWSIERDLMDLFFRYQGRDDDIHKFDAEDIASCCGASPERIMLLACINKAVRNHCHKITYRQFLAHALLFSILDDQINSTQVECILKREGINRDNVISIVNEIMNYEKESE